MNHRLPNNLNISFLGVDSDKLIEALSGLAVSSGAACSSASRDSSYVLRAIGASDLALAGSVRFSVGRFNTAEEIDRAVLAVADAVRVLRSTPRPVGPTGGLRALMDSQIFEAAPNAPEKATFCQESGFGVRGSGKEGKTVATHPHGDQLEIRTDRPKTLDWKVT